MGMENEKPEQTYKRRGASQWAVAWRRFRRNRAGVAGLVIVVATVFFGFFGDVLAPFPEGADATVTHMFTSPPSFLQNPPKWDFIFGTATNGADIYSQVLHGAKYTLYVGILVTIITMVVAIVVGSLAGFFGRWVDNVLMRITEIFLVFPSFLFILVLAKLYNLSPAYTPFWTIPLINLRIPAGLTIVIVVLAIFNWAANARMVRGEFLRVRELEFVEAERALGASNFRIIFRHVLPNILSSVIVVSSLTIAYAILLEAAVSFLGFGDPNTITWGQILQLNFPDSRVVWWGELFPGLAIIVTVLGFNLLGDGLSDALNPRLRD